MCAVVAAHPFEDEGGARLEWLPAQRAPLRPVHLGPLLRLQVLIEVVPQQRGQWSQGHAVSTAIAPVTAEREREREREMEREMEREIEGRERRTKREGDR